jgi:hypothetical protein
MIGKRGAAFGLVALVIGIGMMFGGAAWAGQPMVVKGGHLECSVNCVQREECHGKDTQQE